MKVDVLTFVRRGTSEKTVVLRQLSSTFPFDFCERITSRGQGDLKKILAELDNEGSQDFALSSDRCLCLNDQINNCMITHHKSTTSKLPRVNCEVFNCERGSRMVLQQRGAKFH